MRREFPDALVLRDQPIPLIEPRKTLEAEHKSKLAAADLWHLGLIGLAAARKRKKPFKGTGEGVTVAVLDTGVEASHPEIKHAVLSAYTFDAKAWKAKKAKKSVDTLGHGTHVTGLIAGKTVGTAPGASVVSGVMLPGGHGQLSDFVLALEWCASQPHIQIVNVSAGIRGYLPGMHNVVADLLAVGLLPVVACGNEGRNKTRSPGNYAEVMSVGACNKRSKVSDFSSGGTIVSDQHQYKVPDLVAPGEGVYSCVQGGGYEAWDGTSMAAPIVSAVAALVLERHPKITIGQLQEELLTTCKDIGQDEDRQGKGLVQVKAAL
jgi:subtilisin family serine protease